MPDNREIEEVEAEHRRLVGPPLEPDGLTVVVRGEDRLGTWELRDGPHPMPQDPDAVRHELILRRPGQGGSISTGIGPRLGPGEIGRLGTSAHAGRGDNIGYVEVRCQSSVAFVRVHYDDGSVSEVPTSLSATTALRWAVCPLDSASIATRIEFLDDRGAALDVQAVGDPRTYEPE
jgi:hypothetical protein